MRKYPIGLQDFRKIREDGFLYIDKTQVIHTLVGSGGYYFLSRPRRFGKSLLLSTIKEIFSGDKKLFKGLWIENNWNWEQRHPVIYIPFSSIGVRTLGLREAIFKILRENATRLGVSLEESTIDQQFRELIRKASVNGRVVILIDEYDKPIIDNLDDIPKAEENRSVMKDLYSVLKDADEYIQFLLITGVSRFSKVSIFSDLNNLNDITIHRRYATIAGITQDELERDFAEEIEEIGKTMPDILERLKNWYNGYSWHPQAEKVYNPFSLLKFMDGRDFQNYWFATGSPSFLIKLIQGKGEYKFEDIHVGGNALGNFDIVNTVPASLLFQTGYLTIKGYSDDTGTYQLDYPNQEVKSSLLDNLLSAYREVFPGDSMAITGNLLIALRQNDIPSVIRALDSIIGTIPYDHWKADTESIFHIITHLTFKKVGVDVESEVHSSLGRCDVLVKTAKYIYGIELKLDVTAQEALDQIITKNYLQPYQSDPREKIALGISFSSQERKVMEYLAEPV